MYARKSIESTKNAIMADFFNFLPFRPEYLCDSWRRQWGICAAANVQRSEFEKWKSEQLLHITSN
jgi:hypothetical protein